MASAVMYLGGYRGYYFVDDFSNLVLARGSRLTLHFLGIGVYGHFIPGFRLQTWVASRLFLTDYDVSLALAVTLFGSCILVMYGLLVFLFGRSWWNVVLLLPYAFSTIWMPTLWWQAAAWESLVALLFTLLALTGWLRWWGSGRRAWVLLALASFSCGLLFYDKVLLLTIILPLSGILLMPKLPLRTILARLAAIIPISLVAALYLANYFGRHYYIPTARPTVPKFVGFLLSTWSGELVPGILGGPLRWDFAFTGGALGLSATPSWFAVLAQLLLLAIATVSLVRWPGAWRGWVFAIACFGLSMGLVGYARISTMGSAAATDNLYVLDPGTYLLLGAAFALRGVPAKGIRGELLQGPRAVAGAVPVLVLVVAAFSVSTASLSSAWSHGPAVAYTSNLRRDIRIQLERGFRRGADGMTNIPVAEGTVPNSVMPNQDGWFPYYKFSYFGRLFGLVAAGANPVPGFTIDAAGHLAAARFAPAFRGGAPCPPTGRSGQPEVTPPTALGRSFWYVRVRSAGGPAHVHFAIDPGSGTYIDGDGRFQFTELGASATGLYPLQATAISRLRVDIRPDGPETPCLPVIQIGTIEPDYTHDVPVNLAR
ncbi:MAG: hypothetical protein ACYDGR_09090 [Candidatus Dormibacteria bacterium]